MTVQAGPDPVLRPTTEADLDWVLEAERAPDQLPFVSQWPRDLHARVIAEPGGEHHIIEWRGAPAGYAILRGVGDPNGSIELMRLVVTEKGRGIGRAALRALLARVFDTHAAHRLWLDVFTHNARARSLYLSAGFVEEGTLRECLVRDGVHRSLVVMSMLRHEYVGWRDRSGDGEGASTD